MNLEFITRTVCQFIEASTASKCQVLRIFNQLMSPITTGKASFTEWSNWLHDAIEQNSKLNNYKDASEYVAILFAIKTVVFEEELEGSHNSIM